MLVMTFSTGTSIVTSAINSSWCKYDRPTCAAPTMISLAWVRISSDSVMKSRTRVSEVRRSPLICSSSLRTASICAARSASNLPCGPTDFQIGGTVIVGAYPAGNGVIASSMPGGRSGGSSGRGAPEPVTLITSVLIVSLICSMSVVLTTLPL